MCSPPSERVLHAIALLFVDHAAANHREWLRDFLGAKRGAKQPLAARWLFRRELNNPVAREVVNMPF